MSHERVLFSALLLAMAVHQQQGCCHSRTISPVSAGGSAAMQGVYIPTTIKMSSHGSGNA